MSTEKLNKALAGLPKEVKENATALLKKMEEKIEGIGDESIDWKPETLKIVQAVSDRSKLPKGTQIGDLVLGEHIVPRPIPVIPLRSWETRQYWHPDQTENKLLCSSPDAVLGYIGKYCKSCEFAKYDEEAKKSACNKTKTFLVITADLKQVFLMNFSKTGYTNGMDWLALQKKAGVAPYRRTYAIKSQTSQKYKNVESIVVDPHSVTPDSYHDFLQALFDKFSEDRKLFLADFHENVLNRKPQTGNLIENTEGTDDSNLITVQTEVNAEQKNLGTKYAM